MLALSSINFNSAQVNSTKQSVSAAFEALETVVRDMETKKKELSTFWSSQEANDFSQKLDNLHDMITKFNTKYADYMSVIDQVYTAYEIDNANFVLSINALKGNE